MTEPGTLRDGRRIAYGFGLFVAERGGRVELSHGGDNEEFGVTLRPLTGHRTHLSITLSGRVFGEAVRVP